MRQRVRDRNVGQGYHWHALLQDLQHGPIPLLHDAQFHQLTRLPPCDQPVIAGKRTERLKAGNQHEVSPTNRNYCRPATRTTSANCHQEPEPMFSNYRVRTGVD